MLPFPLLPRSIRYTAVAVVGGIIYYRSLITTPETTIDQSGSRCSNSPTDDATNHWELLQKRHALLTIAAATAYESAMEAGQTFLPHRFPILVTNILVNALGESLALVWLFLRPHLNLRPDSTFLPDIE